jgi:DNA processing protein
LEEKWVRTLLDEIPQPPRTLYIRGQLPPVGHKRVTIVGSRRCSQYARQVVEEICASLAGQPVTIISGLALGIDSHAHECALRHGLHTIAVLGSGIDDDSLYPRRQGQLAYRILESGGALISEYGAGTHALKWMLPARNRIMVGLADLVIVIEAREKSGTLISARMATDYNRDLMAVPNSVHSPYSKGSNDLIRQGAYVYTCPRNIYELLGLEHDESQAPAHQPSDDEKIILGAIATGHIQTQQIIEACSSKLAVSQVIQILLNLEIENVIKRIDGTYVVLRSC